MSTAYAAVPIMNKMSSSHPVFQRLTFRMSELEQRDDFGLLGDGSADARWERLDDLREWVIRHASQDFRAANTSANVLMYHARLDGLDENPAFWAAAEQYELGQLPLAWLASFIGATA